jgi:hypothetical protein
MRLNSVDFPFLPTVSGEFAVRAPLHTFDRSSHLSSRILFVSPLMNLQQHHTVTPIRTRPASERLLIFVASYPMSQVVFTVYRLVAAICAGNPFPLLIHGCIHPVV